MQLPTQVFYSQQMMWLHIAKNAATSNVLMQQNPEFGNLNPEDAFILVSQVDGFLSRVTPTSDLAGTVLRLIMVKKVDRMIVLDAISSRIRTLIAEGKITSDTAKRNVGELNIELKQQERKTSFNSALQKLSSGDQQLVQQAKAEFQELQKENPTHYRQLLLLTIRRFHEQGQDEIFNTKVADRKLGLHQKQRLAYAKHIPGMEAVIGEIAKIPKLPPALQARLEKYGSLSNGEIKTLTSDILQSGYLTDPVVQSQVAEAKLVFNAFGGSGVIEQGAFVPNDDNKNFGAAANLNIFVSGTLKSLYDRLTSMPQIEAQTTQIIRRELESLRQIQSFSFKL